MKKLNRIVWMLILLISSTLSMESDSWNGGQPPIVQNNLISRTQIWQNGDKISETTTYAPQAQEPIRRSGMGAWDNPNWQPTERTPYVENNEYW